SVKDAVPTFCPGTLGHRTEGGALAAGGRALCQRPRHRRRGAAHLWPCRGAALSTAEALAQLEPHCLQLHLREFAGLPSGLALPRQQPGLARVLRLHRRCADAERRVGEQLGPRVPEFSAATGPACGAGAGVATPGAKRRLRRRGHGGRRFQSGPG
ncbi:unnamed protein product, partial [Effrenium voratum]